MKLPERYELACFWKPSHCHRSVTYQIFELRASRGRRAACRFEVRHGIYRKVPFFNFLLNALLQKKKHLELVEYI